MNMPRTSLIVTTKHGALLLLLLVTQLALTGPPALRAGESELASLLPPEPLLVLRASRFAEHLAEARSAASMSAWLEGTAGKRYLQSRLHLKLRDRFKDWGKTLELDVTLDRVAELAGAEGVLALYDVGDLRFCFLGRLGEAAWKASALAAARKGFESLRVGRGEVHLKRDKGGAVTLGVAWRDGTLVAANRMDLFTHAVEALEGKAHGAFPVDRGMRALWQGEASADFLLWLDQKRINADDYFGNYWIGRSPESLAWMEETLVALRLREDGMDERRFFRAADGKPRGSTTDELARLRALCPEGAELRQVEAFADATALGARLARLFWARRFTDAKGREALVAEKVDETWTAALVEAEAGALATASRAGRGPLGVLPRRERVLAVATKKELDVDVPARCIARALGRTLAGRPELIAVEKAEGRRILRDPLTARVLLALESRPGALFLADDLAFLDEAVKATPVGPLRPEGAVSHWSRLDLDGLRRVGRAWFVPMGERGGGDAHWTKKTFVEAVLASLTAFDGIASIEIRRSPRVDGMMEEIRYRR